MKYIIVKGKACLEGKDYITYGITNGIDYINDISTDSSSVLKLVKLLNDNNVSPIHFRDVVEDFVQQGALL